MGGTKSKPAASFIKAGMLLGLLVLVYACIELLSNKGLPARLTQLFSAQMVLGGKADMFTESQQDSIRKAYTGFYVMVPDPAIDSARFSWSDRIEIKANGIIWEVRDYRMRMPSGDTVHFMHALNSFLYPWSRRVVPSGVKTLSEVRILYQAVIGNGDSCYGESHVDYVVNLDRHADGGISVLGRKYVAYTGDLKEFFPRGATKMVDDIRLKKCLTFQTFAGFAFDRVVSSLGKVGNVLGQDSAAVAGIVRDYYAPLMWHQIVEQFPVEDLVLNTPPIKVAFTVGSKGDVSSVRVLGAGPTLTKIEQFIAKNMSQWRFPTGKTDQLTNGSYEFRF